MTKNKNYLQWLLIFILIIQVLYLGYLSFKNIDNQAIEKVKNSELNLPKQE